MFTKTILFISELIYLRGSEQKRAKDGAVVRDGRVSGARGSEVRVRVMNDGGGEALRSAGPGTKHLTAHKHREYRIGSRDEHQDVAVVWIVCSLTIAQVTISESKAFSSAWSRSAALLASPAVLVLWFWIIDFVLNNLLTVSVARDAPCRSFSPRAVNPEISANTTVPALWCGGRVCDGEGKRERVRDPTHAGAN